MDLFLRGQNKLNSTFLETLISNFDFWPVKLQGLLRNGPLVTFDEVGAIGHRPPIFGAKLEAWRYNFHLLQGDIILGIVNPLS